MIKNLFKNILLASHPVGSIYITTDGSFDPHESWGGSWELLEDRFLVGAGNTYTLGASGGEAEHTLTVDEMPSHGHDSIHYAANGGKIALDSGTSGGYRLTYNGQTNPNSFINTSNTGGDSAHNNLPPYTAVNMWLRTA